MLQVCSYRLTVLSALEVFNAKRYINLRFTYLLTFLYQNKTKILLFIFFCVYQQNGCRQ